MTDTARAASPVVAFGRLLRIALFPSALADVVVGIAIGHHAQWPALALPWLLVPASLGVYHGAMALNDWVDRHDDARTRPERPIPSGAIPAPAALAVALVLVGGGLLWAFAAGPRAGVWMSAVALLAVTYDVAGRGPLRGPVLLGLCRAGNLGAGLLSPWLIGSEAAPNWTLLLIAGVYGAHVFFISRLGRLEDDEDDDALADRPTVALGGVAWTWLALPVAAAAAVALDAAAWGGFARGSGLILTAGIAAFAAVKVRERAVEGARAGWSRADVGAATGFCLRKLPMFTASVAAIGLIAGPAAVLALAVALVGARVSGALRGLFPLT